MKKKVSLQGFTVNQLIKRLEKLRDNGHGRKRVCVDTESFRNNLDANICPVTGIGMTLVEMLDDDGFSTERTRHTATLVGWCRSDSNGGIVALIPLAAPSPTTETGE